MITLIAAIGKNNELGKNNKMIWHLPSDMKRFKKKTTGHHIIMGRKTYESIGKALPNRTTIILTRDVKYKAEDCLIAHSLEDALLFAKEDSNAFIIGGADIYKIALGMADCLDICRVHDTFDADVFFPSIDLDVWQEKSREDHVSDEHHLHPYSFITYMKE